VPVLSDALAADYAYLVHFSPTEAQRKAFIKAKISMPDGSFYIRNADDLDNAIRAVGRATPNADESEVARRNSVRRHVMRRARFLKLQAKIPDTWNSDGSLKQSGIREEEIRAFLAVTPAEAFLEHFGVKGMRWGVRRSRMQLEKGSHTAPRPGTFRKITVSRPKHTPVPAHVSVDAARVIQIKSQLARHGPSSLSNDDLNHLVRRMQLENQFGQLNQAHVSTGRKVVSELAGIGTSVGKQVARDFAAKHAAKGVEHLIKMATK
jgi:hypothetical protein